MKMALRRDWRRARAKVDAEGICRCGCGRTRFLEAAHLANRSFDVKRPVPWPHEWKQPVLVHPDRIVPLAPSCHRAYDAHELDLAGRLTQDEEVQLVADLGLELARKRITPSDYRPELQDARAGAMVGVPL